jgi:enoyl-CoA hydratase/carnithine racemase
VQATVIPLPPALDARAIRALDEAIAVACRDTTARALVLEGRDGVFCCGMELRALVEDAGDERAAERLAEGFAAFARCLVGLRLAPKPTIAAVDGEALGGGVGLAAACDLVLATDRSTFGLPELLYGFVPATVLPVLLERMPAQKVRLMALSGHAHRAARARELGLVDELAPDGQLGPALRRAVRLLTRAHPAAVAALKHDTAATPHLELSAAVRRAARRSAEALGDRAVLDGIRAFVGEGTPPWLAR